MCQSGRRPDTRTLARAHAMQLKTQVYLFNYYERCLPIIGYYKKDIQMDCFGRGMKNNYYFLQARVYWRMPQHKQGTTTVKRYCH